MRLWEKLVLVGLVLLMVFLVWPTMWTYEVLHGPYGDVLLRVNRLTGGAGSVAGFTPPQQPQQIAAPAAPPGTPVIGAK